MSNCRLCGGLTMTNTNYCAFCKDIPTFYSRKCGGEIEGPVDETTICPIKGCRRMGQWEKVEDQDD